MSTKQEIILRYFRDGQSQRQISRELHIARLTVQRYVEAYKESRSKIDFSSAHVEEGLIEAIVEAPSYDSSTREKRRLTPAIESAIQGYLQKNAEKRRQGLHKQTMKKIDIHEALQLEGHQIGYTTVCNYIRSQDNKPKEAYIRQEYSPGEVCEFDWGEVKLNIGGKWRKYQLAVFTSAYSNYRYSRLFHRQDSASYQQSHVDFFNHTGRVYQTMVYDNMKVAVRKFVGPKEKEATEGLLKLSSYYQFRFRFCNVRRGNEKGHVERSVEYIRRKAFSAEDTFGTLEEANTWLGSTCEHLNTRNKAIQTAYSEEQGQMPTSPPRFDCGQLFQLHVDKYSTVSHDVKHYSVPDYCVGKMVSVRVYPEKIKCFYEGKEVAVHERSYEELWNLHLEHYLETLHRKPGALAGSVALTQADEKLRDIYHQYYEHQPREFIDLVQYMKAEEISVEKVEDIIGQLKRINPGGISTDKIKLLCHQQQQVNIAPDPAPPDHRDPIAEYARKQLAQLSCLFPDHANLQAERGAAL